MKKILFVTTVFVGLFSCMTASAQKDARTREYITPVRVVWTQGEISNADALLNEGNGQADFMQRVHCDMKSTRKAHPAIILDFGRELHGGLHGSGRGCGLPAGNQAAGGSDRHGL